MNKNIYILIIGVLIALFILRECENSNDKKLLRETVSSLDKFNSQEDSSYFAGKDIEINDTKDQVQNNVASMEEFESLAEQFGEVKKVNALIKAELHAFVSGGMAYRLDTMYLAMDTSTYIHRDSVAKYFVSKGTKASKHDLWYDLAVTLDDSLQIDSLRFREKVDAILGYKRPKWWKAKEPVVRIQSYNPYTTIGNVNNLVVTDEKSKFVKVMTSKPLMFVYGAVAGYGVRSIQGN